MDIKGYFSKIKEEIDTALDSCLPSEDDYPPEINRAMRYSMFAGGKRLRPILLIASAEALGGKRETVLPFAGAIEMIHTYTLIHDDLPALDNDDFRRGRPANHKIFGEAAAVLAGDGLLTTAFQVMTDVTLMDGIPAPIICRVTNEIARAVGTLGTIGGQIVDMQSEEQRIDISTLEYIHTHKTGKMICAAVRAGAILAGGSEKEIKVLTDYGEKIGLAFQIVDDVLDIEGDQKKLGKDVGSDIEKDKATYPSILGIDESKTKANKLVEQGIASLRDIGEKGKILNDIARYIVKRRA